MKSLLSSFLFRNQFWRWKVNFLDERSFPFLFLEINQHYENLLIEINDTLKKEKGLWLEILLKSIRRKRLNVISFPNCMWCWGIWGECVDKERMNREWENGSGKVCQSQWECNLGVDDISVWSNRKSIMYCISFKINWEIFEEEKWGIVNKNDMERVILGNDIYTKATFMSKGIFCPKTHELKHNKWKWQWMQISHEKIALSLSHFHFQTFSSSLVLSPFTQHHHVT